MPGDAPYRPLELTPSAPPNAPVLRRLLVVHQDGVEYALVGVDDQTYGITERGALLPIRWRPQSLNKCLTVFIDLTLPGPLTAPRAPNPQLENPSP